MPLWDIFIELMESELLCRLLLAMVGTLGVVLNTWLIVRFVIRLIAALTTIMVSFCSNMGWSSSSVPIPSSRKCTNVRYNRSYFNLQYSVDDLGVSV